ncbi:MAG: DNA helicase [Flavobacterium sp. BFFFF2]|nr:MAG: DNA helicase [Flavobacterium sp. BFFFF2]
MEWTKEQLDIIQSSGDIKINAVAGSGKTTTIIEYAKSRPENSRILYLAFNKSVKLEAMKKFRQKGLHNVHVETAHSVAFKHIVGKNRYQIKAHGYQSYEIAELLQLQGNGEKHTEYIIAHHINKCVACFCNSDQLRVQDVNYLDTISDPKAKTFVTTFYHEIIKQSRLFLKKMDEGDIEITHDFYLKKFQLSNPSLHYDYILFDEGQDASPAMLAVFLNQKATKVIVGDTHQQIYGWRFAVNSLEKVDFKTLYLSTSFRFGEDIAQLAMDLLQFKKHLGPYEPIAITGVGCNKEFNSKAVIARTNLGLLLKAIEYITENKEAGAVYFEGNIHSYTYADDGASLYDVLKLFNKRTHSIKDKLIRSMKSLVELEDYVKKTEDMQLGMMVEIVRKYKNRIPGLIQKLKDKHVEDHEKEQAAMIFSTVHRCKGMEYDQVQLVNDFITEEKIKQAFEKYQEDTIDRAKLNEEINLLYVAVTRSKSKLLFPESLLPINCSITSEYIELVKPATETKQPEGKEADGKMQPKLNTEKAYDLDEIRKKHQEAFRPWTPELDDELTVLYCEGLSIKYLAKHFGRTHGAIRARIVKLELEELYG